MAKYALLVGISKYQDPEITDLPFAARDAEVLGESLEKDCGFDDVRVLSTDSEEIIGGGAISRELIDLRSLMEEEDTFLFFFAGHGQYRDGQSVLLPADARWAMPALSDLQIPALVGEMNNLQCSQRALVFDCCRNDPEASRGQGDNRLSDDFTRDIKAAAQSGSGRVSSTCLLFSCSRGERAFEWSGKRHGVYTYYFLKALKEKAWSGGRVTIQDVAGYLEEEVPGWAEKNGHTQLPWSEMYGSLRPIILSERLEQGGESKRVSPAKKKPARKKVSVAPIPGSPKLLHTLIGSEDVIDAVFWSEDGIRLASWSSGDTLGLWDVESGSNLEMRKCHFRMADVIALSPDWATVASGDNFGTVRLWDAETGYELHELRKQKDYLARREAGSLDLVRINAIDWSPDGSKIASGSKDSTVKVWDATSGRLLRVLKGRQSAVWAVGWSPDGTLLASGHSDGKVRLWDAETGPDCINTLKGHELRVWTIAWSPDGTLLASGSWDGTVRVWAGDFDSKNFLDRNGRLKRTISAHEIYRFKGHGDYVNGVAWSPDGSKLASCSRDGTVRVLDAFNGKEIYELKGHGHWVWTVAWSPDATMLASGSWDKTIKIWSIPK